MSPNSCLSFNHHCICCHNELNCPLDTSIEALVVYVTSKLNFIQLIRIRASLRLRGSRSQKTKDGITKMLVEHFLGRLKALLHQGCDEARILETLEKRAR